MFNLLHIGKTALEVSQLQLQTIGQNISNVNTEGYSRQRVVQSALSTDTNVDGYYGSGVEAVRLERMRDLQLDISYRDENSQLGTWARMSERLQTLEAELAEPGDYGLSTMLSEFWDAWEQLADNPSDSTYRTNLLGATDNLATAFHELNTSLVDERAQVDDEIAGIADTVNGIASQLANLNLRIQEATSQGNAANDLEDSYDLLVDQLSTYGNVSVQTREDGSRIVYFGSDELVKNDSYREMSVLSEKVDGVKTSTLVWKDSRETLNGLHQGQIVGLVSLRDDMIGGYIDNLDILAVGIATAVNALHTLGYDGTSTPSDGRYFFATDITGAADFRINEDIADHPELIAASQSGAEGDNRIALQIAGLRGSAQMEDGSSFGDYFSAWLGNVGSDSAQAQNSAAAHQETTALVDNYRESVKGVSLDEEATKLIQYQQTYNAAAKLVSMVDEMLSVVIGMVG